MAHHKRRRPKNRRAGCLLCKPHKANGVKKRGAVGGRGSKWSGPWNSEQRAHNSEKEQRLECYRELHTLQR